jgi:formate/nitrite transporter FocA (FNT family)
MTETEILNLLGGLVLAWASGYASGFLLKTVRQFGEKL